MSTGTRGVVRHTLIYGLGTLLQKGVSFLMLPLYTRLLTPTDYGILALIDMTLDVISIGAGAQLAYAIFRFYHKADTEAERHTVVSTVFVALTVHPDGSVAESATAFASSSVQTSKAN